jgi:translation initiation factor IF-3
VNELIRVREVRVVGQDGSQLGIMETAEALRLAEEQGFDLVEVAPNEKPPVCRIMDYGKYKYQQSKRLQQAKKKQNLSLSKKLSCDQKPRSMTISLRVCMCGVSCKMGTKPK